MAEEGVEAGEDGGLLVLRLRHGLLDVRQLILQALIHRAGAADLAQNLQARQTLRETYRFASEFGRQSFKHGHSSY